MTKGYLDFYTIGHLDFRALEFKCLESGPSIRPSDYSGTALTQINNIRLVRDLSSS